MARKRPSVFVISVAAHVVLGAGVLVIKPEIRKELIAIAMSSPSEDEPKKEQPKPEPEPPKADAPKQKSATPQRTRAANPNPNPSRTQTFGDGDGTGDGPDYGLSLGNADGPGLEVSQGGGGAPPPPKPEPPKVVTRAPTAVTTKAEVCTEDLVKAKPRTVPQPSYTQEARDADVEGRIRVEVSIDDAGRVTGAKVLAGLGHGLDEQALAAAKGAAFAPATKCGKAVASTFVFAMRFTL